MNERDALPPPSGNTKPGLTCPPQIRRWRQISLRTLLGLMSLLSIGLAWLATNATHATRERHAVESMPGVIARYDYQRAADQIGGWDVTKTPPAPALLRQVLGDNLFAKVVYLKFDDYFNLRSTFQSVALANLKELHSLEYLNLEGIPTFRLSDTDLMHISQLTRLNRLNLSGSDITDEGLAHLADLAQLEFLTLNDTHVAGEGLVHLSKCKQIKVLELICSPVTADGARSIRQLGSLQYLVVSSPEAGDTVLESCADLRQMNWLSVSGIHGDSLRHVCNLRSLTHLSCMQSDIGEGDLRHLRTLPRLNQLILADSSVADAALSDLDGLDGLESLDLCNTDITDAGAQHLAGLKNLRELDLGGTRISITTLAYLRGLEKLEHLNLYRTELDEMADDELARALPHFHQQ